MKLCTKAHVRPQCRSILGSCSCAEPHEAYDLRPRDLGASSCAGAWLRCTGWHECGDGVKVRCVEVEPSGNPGDSGGEGVTYFGGKNWGRENARIIEAVFRAAQEYLRGRGDPSVISVFGDSEARARASASAVARAAEWFCSEPLLFPKDWCKVEPRWCGDSGLGFGGEG